jgi:hypothetical protein
MKKILRKIKHNIVQSLIGNYYTEKEVKKTLSKMQYDMAQKIIGNRPNQKPIVPFEYWMENNDKYDTNLYRI